jgi:uncharacterized protein YdiU (UPF0061 family)
MTVHIPFDNSYARLPEGFFALQKPTPVSQPQLVVLNEVLARELGLDPDELRSRDGVDVLAGNLVPDGAEPLAQAYAGHQFAGWVPRLGDGRAVLLGEVIDATGQRRDIQLKGAGRTPFSRGGDGRAWLGPVLREFIVSEAMQALGIPTTRALAAVTTGQEILRETVRPGAVLTRVAASHIRVGTFQYFAARQEISALQALAQHVIARHYPDARSPLDLLNAVIARQARLIAKWMGVGFIHGVMNTDNMAISGETIDYGPCAFMDGYDPGTVYSSIDRFGRYAYDQQPRIAVWNLAQFATCLIPLMGEKDAAIAAATEAVHGFPDVYAKEWQDVFGKKLGFARAMNGDKELIQEFLDEMARSGADFTITFRNLSNDVTPDGMEDWAARWRRRRDEERSCGATDISAANPAFIPRNHLIEQAIAAATAGDFAPFHRLNSVLARPFEEQSEFSDLQSPPQPHEVVERTFCGT